MAVHRFQIKDANSQRLREFTIISKIAKREGTGFYLDFKNPKPTLKNVKIVTRYPRQFDEITLEFESKDPVEANFKAQLSERLMTKLIIKI
jgi:hypothetical protein